MSYNRDIDNILAKISELESAVDDMGHSSHCPCSRSDDAVAYNDCTCGHNKASGLVSLIETLVESL